MTGRGHDAGSPSRETTELRQEHEPRTQAVADMLLKRRPVRSRELPRRRLRRPGHGPIGRGGQRVVWCHRHALPVVRLAGLPRPSTFALVAGTVKGMVQGRRGRAATGGARRRASGDGRSVRPMSASVPLRHGLA